MAIFPIIILMVAVGLFNGFMHYLFVTFLARQNLPPAKRVFHRLINSVLLVSLIIGYGIFAGWIYIITDAKVSPFQALLIQAACSIFGLAMGFLILLKLPRWYLMNGEQHSSPASNIGK